MKQTKILGFTLFATLLATFMVVGCIKKSTESCSDGIQNQSEQAVDCGGPCAACPTCVDGIQNQNETGIDCGGPCPQCVTCNDGKKNGDETDVDCGGSKCAPCPIVYPASGLYGVNLLCGTDTLFTNGGSNSLRAIVPQGQTVKIEFEYISGTPWGYIFGTGNWVVSPFANNRQTFEALNAGIYELQINKYCPIGQCGGGLYKIKFYENGNTITRTRIVKMT